MVRQFLTTKQRAELLENGKTHFANREVDPVPVARLFTPDAHAVWLLAALDPANCDTAWGLIDIGIGMPQLGTVKLSDLTAIVGPHKRPVASDRHFQTSQPMSMHLRRAKRDGSIVDV